MGEAKLETVTEVDHRIFIYDHSAHGFSLRFVSGPVNVENLPKRGEWLDRWEEINGKRRFSFGPKPAVVFTEKQGAEAVQAELKRAVDFITEVI